MSKQEEIYINEKAYAPRYTGCTSLQQNLEHIIQAASNAYNFLKPETVHINLVGWILTSETLGSLQWNK